MIIEELSLQIDFDTACDSIFQNAELRDIPFYEVQERIRLSRPFGIHDITITRCFRYSRKYAKRMHYELFFNTKEDKLLFELTYT